MNKPKKLTIEVFKRKSCPKWARYAAVNKSGLARYFEDDPFVDKELCGWDTKGCSEYCGVFDATDWEHSLIKRPEVKK